MERIIGERSAASIQPTAGKIEPSELDEKTLAESGFYWRESGGVKVLACRPLEQAGLVNGFSTRLGGVSSLRDKGELAKDHGTELNLAGFNEDSAENIYENRRRFLAVFDGSYSLATAWQVHGDKIRLVENDRHLGDADEHADALISDLNGVLIGVKTADCVPILIGDPDTSAFAAVHAGWRGTAQSIVAKAVEKMKTIYAAAPSRLVCAIGPAAGCERYEVGVEVIDIFREKFSTGGKYFRPTRPGHAMVDLKLANRDQLVDAGVQVGNIFIAPFCTIERVDLFFSYRIEKSRFGRTGRLLSVIGRGHLSDSI